MNQSFAVKTRKERLVAGSVIRYRTANVDGFNIFYREAGRAPTSKSASSNQPRQSEENSYESKSFNANEEARIYPGDA
jgi:uncharacterized protein YxeA